MNHFGLPVYELSIYMLDHEPFRVAAPGWLMPLVMVWAAILYGHREKEVHFGLAGYESPEDILIILGAGIIGAFTSLVWSVVLVSTALYVILSSGILLMIAFQNE